MNPSAKRVVVSALAAIALPLVADAQSEQAAAAISAAYDQLSAGNYPEAAAAYEKVLKDFPSDAAAPSAALQLAQTYYFLKDYDKAQATLTQAFSGPPLSAEQREAADALLPQILLAKASAMPPDAPGRKMAHEEAISKFGAYVAKYPNSPGLEATVRSLALANLQIQKYNDAVNALKQNIQRFPKSPTIDASKDLLAVVLATQGSEELAKAKGLKDFSRYTEAAELLREIIREKSDIAMMNDASAQLGEILLSQAAYSEPEDRPKLYEEALAALRGVAPVEQVVAWQKEKIAGYRALKRAAIAKRDMAQLSQLNRENEFELRRLAEIQARPDQVSSALLKMAEIYFQQGKYNEARVVLDHVLPFLTTDDEKKRQLYFLTMTYAMQGLPDRAQAGFDELTSAYPGDPLADNLPYAMGNMFLSLNDASAAIPYFEQSLSIYPDGRFADVSRLGMASAEARLGKIDEAKKIFQDVLAKKPSAEVGAIAQMGMATVLKDNQKWDDAIAAYEESIKNFPTMPQAVESAYWIAICTQQKGMNEESIPMLDKFLAGNPTSPLAPLALYAKANAQVGVGDRKGAAATLGELAEKFPSSQPAPFAYFTRARLLAQEGLGSEAVAQMRKFIEQYPGNEKLLAAHDAIAEISINDGRPDDAVATYREFLETNPEAKEAGEALVKIAKMKNTTAQAVGKYFSLSAAERERWKTLIEESASTVEELIRKYPDSAALSEALGILLEDQILLYGAGLKKEDEIETYFKNLAEATPAPAKGMVLFTLAAFVKPGNPAEALAIMEGAYDPKAEYQPKDLDSFGLLLIENGKLDQAADVFAKLAADFPIPTGATQIAPEVQEAQAAALFGKARIAQKRGDIGEAGEIFRKLKDEYPWSPKVPEADYGIAEALRAEGKLDEALNLLGGVIRAPSTSAELRANSMLLGGYLMVEKRKDATSDKDKSDFLAAAIDYFIKIAQFYGGVPPAASRGLWEGGRLLEEQAAESTDEKFKTQQLDKARAAYRQLAADFPDSEFAPKAQERLGALR